MMKEFNRKGVKFHGYMLGVSGAEYKMTTFQNKTQAQKNYKTRTPGYFEPYMITKVQTSLTVKEDITAPIHTRTSQEEYEKNMQIILNLAQNKIKVKNGVNDVDNHNIPVPMQNHPEEMSISNENLLLNTSNENISNGVLYNISNGNMTLSQIETESDCDSIENLFNVSHNNIWSNSNMSEYLNQTTSNVSESTMLQSHILQEKENDDLQKATNINEKRNLIQQVKQDDITSKLFQEHEHQMCKVIMQNAITDIKKKDQSILNKIGPNKNRPKNKVSLMETNDDSNKNHDKSTNKLSITNTNDNSNDKKGYPEQFLNLRYKKDEWQVLIKWKDYSTNLNSWENTKETNINDPTYQQLVSELCSKKKWNKLPDLDQPPTPKKKRKAKTLKTDKKRQLQLTTETCPHAIDHRSSNKHTKMFHLQPEYNSDYVKEGELLDRKKCFKCTKTFVKNPTNSRQHTTMSRNKPAWHCPHLSSGCEHVCCNNCYEKQIKFN